MDQQTEPQSPEIATRTYEYERTAFDPAAAMRLSGLDYFKEIILGENGARPSMLVTLGVKGLPEVEYGKAVFEAEPADFLLNPMGTVHGGFAATLLDSVLGVSVHTTLEPGFGYSTVELKLNFTRPLLPTSGRLRAEGNVIHRGRQIATADARLIGIEDGKLYAHASTTCMIFPLKPSGH